MKLFIRNRKNQKIAVIVDQGTNDQLAFVMHGLGGFKEQAHVKTIADSFLQKGFTTIRFDTTNTLGESDGDYGDATVTNYYEDLEDTINWATSQDWYQESFFLAGHSLGGISTALYAQNYPDKVKGLAPISTVISGKLSLETPAYSKEELEKWERTGLRIKPSASKPGVMKKLKWSFLADKLKYNLLPKATSLTMPVLLVVGSEDEGTPAKHQQILYNALPEPKSLHIIQGAPHTYKNQTHLNELHRIFTEWLEGLL